MGTPLPVPSRTSRTLLALALAVLLVAIAPGKDSASAITSDDDVQFTVTQSPASPVIVQPGSQVTFTVAGSVTLVGGYAGLFFDFVHPAGLSYVSGVSSPPGIACADNTPAPGTARCSYGSVIQGGLVPITLTFTVTGSVTTTASQVQMRAGVGDGSPDDATSGTGDAFNNAGSIQTFGASNIGVATPGAAPVFEGGATSYTTTVTNNSGVSTGAFSSAITFQNATVTSTTCITSSIANGSAGGGGSSVATCTGSSLAAAEVLTITTQLVANNTATGADILPTVSIPGLGINTPGTSVQVDEVGLDKTGVSLVTGTVINICTTGVGSDVLNDAAAGAAQPGTGVLIGSPSLNVLLQPSDFGVVGPAVGVPSPATGCASNQSGIAFTPSLAGSYTVTVSYNVGGTNSLTLAVATAGGTATKLALTQQPTAGAATAAFPLQPVVAIQDALNATVTSDNSTVVTLGLLTGPGALTCTGGLSKTAVSGVATFNGCAVTAAGTYQIRATSSPALTQVDGGTFVVSAAPSASKLGFTAQPSGAVATVAFATQPVVAVQDPSSATFTSDNTTVVSLSLASGPGSLTCTGGLSKTVVNGLATFAGCAVSTNGSGYVLRATSSPVLTQADGNSFNAASFGTAAKLGYLATPAGGSATVPLPIQPQIAIQDASGITVLTDNSTTVALSVLSGPGTLSCTGGTSKTASAGIATFSGCSISASGSYVLRATSSPALTQVDSSSFTVAVGATKLGFTTQPASGVAATALPTQPVVAVQDAGGATVTSDSTTVVTLALTGTGTLTCTGGLSKTATSGIATFAGCAISAAGTGNTLVATSAPILTSATSSAFDVSAQAPTSSAQLVVAAPATGVVVPRSRLAFSVGTGSLGTPTSVTFIIKRKTDNKYWNNATGAWQATLIENAATGSASAWSLAITGDDRREFVGTTVIVEARAVVAAVTYFSAVTPEISIR